MARLQETIIYNISDIENVITKIIQIISLQPGDIIIFTGEPGVGKSTIIHRLIQNIEGINFPTQSPTFTGVQEYTKVIHMDLYLVEKSEKYLDYLLNVNNKLVFIEWGEKYINQLQYNNIIEIDYTSTDDYTRKMKIYSL